VERPRSQRRHRHHPFHPHPLRQDHDHLDAEDGAGNRTIAIGPTTLAALRAWKRTQTAERLRIGGEWRGEHGLVVTNVDGTAPNPEAFSNLFAKLVRATGLPPIRLHDLRDSYATAALAAGVPVKVLSQRVGHADVGVTLAVYAHVMPGDDEDAARRPTRFSPNRDLSVTRAPFLPSECRSDQGQRGGGGRESAIWRERTAQRGRSRRSRSS
jgi:integrase